MALRAIGVDPGPVPGLVLLEFDERRLARIEVIQCSRGVAPLLFRALLTDSPVRTVVQVERYVVSRRSGRSSSAGAGEATRDLVGALANEFGVHSINAELHERAAGHVKPWATNDRLERAGLLDACKGMRHARDAARHALYVAVHDGGIPDPLSKEWSR